MITEAQRKANIKYDRENSVQVSIKLNKKYDKDIIEKLQSEPNKQGYIKDCIRENIRIKELMDRYAVKPTVARPIETITKMAENEC